MVWWKLPVADGAILVVLVHQRRLVGVMLQWYFPDDARITSQRLS
ncbi:MAG TPA: hypothetical protein V6C90_04260 [Coleofasciculaceae cyanobacterium]